LCDDPEVSSAVAFLLLVLAVACERLAELVVSRRHERVLRRRGAVEHGREHYPVMVALHTGLLVAAPAEVLLLGRPFLPWLGLPMVVLVAATMAVRYWVIATLGERWTTRVFVLPGAPLVAGGPFRWLAHPNYLAVAVEVVALPLVHTAWLTAGGFGVANLLLLATRIRVEDRALRGAAGRAALASAERSGGEAGHR
jgi:methyltransferase